MRRDGLMFLSGLVAAAVLLPATVIAAASMVKIEGANGNSANVDAAHQLIVAESDPSSFYSSGYNEVHGTGACFVLVDQSSARALIVTQLRIDVISSPKFDATYAIGFTTDTDCHGKDIFAFQPTHRGSEIDTLVPGFPVPAGSGVSARVIGTSMDATLDVVGYTVPSAAVP